MPAQLPYSSYGQPSPRGQNTSFVPFGMFRFAASPASVDLDDPLFSMPWVFSNVKRDLLLLENQIPFFIRETVFDLSRAPTEVNCSLSQLAFGFFNFSSPGTQHELERPYHVLCVSPLLSQLPFRLFNSFSPKQNELEKHYDSPGRVVLKVIRDVLVTMRRIEHGDVYELKVKAVIEFVSLRHQMYLSESQNHSICFLDTPATEASRFESEEFVIRLCE